MRVFGVSLLLLMMFSAAHAQDHGPGRAACDSKWPDLHKPDSEYQNYIQDCMKNQQSQARVAAKAADLSEAMKFEALRKSAGWGTFDGKWTLPVAKLPDGKLIYLPTPSPYNAKGTLVWEMADGKTNKSQVDQVSTCPVPGAPAVGLKPCFNIGEKAQTTQTTVIMLDWAPNQPPHNQNRSQVLDVVEVTFLGTQRCFDPDPNVSILACTEIIRFGQRVPQHDLASAFANRGSAYSKNGQYARAIEDYDQALQFKSDENVVVVVYLNRGIAYSKNGQYALAIQDYDQAIKLFPNYSLALYHRGLAKQAIGDSAGGDADIVKAKQINPNVPLPAPPASIFPK